LQQLQRCQSPQQHRRVAHCEARCQLPHSAQHSVRPGWWGCQPQARVAPHHLHAAQTWQGGRFSQPEWQQRARRMPRSRSLRSCAQPHHASTHSLAHTHLADVAGCHAGQPVQHGALQGGNPRRTGAQPQHSHATQQHAQLLRCRCRKAAACDTGCLKVCHPRSWRRLLSGLRQGSRQAGDRGQPSQGCTC
jgi:hypothetical protein